MTAAVAEPWSEAWLGKAASSFDVTLLAPEAAATIAITLLGAPGGDRPTTWQVEGERMTATLGDSPDADVVVTIPWADALAIVTGELEPAVAYMRGRLKPSGDMKLTLALMKLGSSPAFATWMSHVAGS